MSYPLLPQEKQSILATVDAASFFTARIAGIVSRHFVTGVGKVAKKGTFSQGAFQMW